MSTAEAIYDLVQTLPGDQAQLVLVFAEFVRDRAQPPENSATPSFSDFFGILKDSPAFSGDPVEIQRAMRSEWD